MEKVEERYCLKWGNYVNAISEIMYKFWEHKSLVDVTLACEEYGKMQFYKAHQMILSACSPYFESLFLQNTHPHPIIYLKDVKGTELQDILTFVYKGEVNVQRNKINSILKTAKSLMIRGLSDESNDSNEHDSHQPANSQNVEPAYGFESKKRKYEEAGIDLSLQNNSQVHLHNQDDDDDEWYKMTNKSVCNKNGSPLFANNKNEATTNEFLPSETTSSDYYKTKTTKNSYKTMFQTHCDIHGVYLCLFCTKLVRSKWHHYQTHFSRNHVCQYCQSVYSRIDTLKIHMKKIHGVQGRCSSSSSSSSFIFGH